MQLQRNLTQLWGVQEWQHRPTNGLFLFSRPSFHVLATERRTEGLVLRSLKHSHKENSVRMKAEHMKKRFFEGPGLHSVGLICSCHSIQRHDNHSFTCRTYSVVIGMLPAVTPLLSIADLQQQAFGRLHLGCCPFQPLQIKHTRCRQAAEISQTSTLQMHKFYEQELACLGQIAPVS